MKNISAIIVLAAFLTFASIRPAAALMAGFSNWVTKIQDYVQKTTEATTMVTQQTNQIKQMSVQGFNKDELLTIGKTVLKNPEGKYIKKQMTGLVKGTKKKNKQAATADKELYVEAKNAYYEQKVEIVVETKEKVDNALQAKKAEEPSKKAEVEKLKQEYEKKKGKSGEGKAYDKYSAAQIEYDKLVADIAELEEHSKKLGEHIDGLKAEAAKVGTSEDKEFVSLEEREKSFDNVEEDLSFTEVEAEEEWDNPNGVDKYVLEEEDYKKFIKRYFYNPDELDSSSEESKLAFQSELDRITRERRYLVINTAAHLLQVTGTVRREIPVRSKAIDAMFKNTPTSSGELEAISSYAATRIENARALLLYAKLLSAKIQYMAARDLVDIETKKRDDAAKTYKNFNMDKYILTDDYVKKLIKEANPEIDKNESK